VYHPGDPFNASKVKPNDPAIFYNSAAAEYCRIKQIPDQDRPAGTCSPFCIVCDAAPVNATVFLYLGNGLSYNGRPLVQVPNSRILIYDDTLSCISSVSTPYLKFPPALRCELCGECPSDGDC
jgi:hypothetical protein